MHIKHSKTDSRSALVHGIILHCSNWWSHAFWSMLPRVVLHHVFLVDGSVLLRFRIPFPYVLDPSLDVCRDHCFVQLFPDLRRRLPLVVAFFHNWRINCTLRLRILLPLLQATRVEQSCYLCVVLWIHGFDFFRAILGHRNCWVLQFSLV